MIHNNRHAANVDALQDLEGFQPTLLGTPVVFQDEGSGMVTDETESAIYIESDFFTGWMSKAEFWEALGVED